MRRTTTLPAKAALALLLACLAGQPCMAQAPSSSGQVVYLAGYSHVYQGVRNTPFPLTIMVLVRNTSRSEAITLESLTYHDTDGRPLPGPEGLPRRIGPLAAFSWVVPEKDLSGGIGASFLVRWRASRPASPPVVESVNLSTRGQTGISFTSQGLVLEELPAKAAE